MMLPKLKSFHVPLLCSALTRGYYLLQRKVRGVPWSLRPRVILLLAIFSDLVFYHLHPYPVPCALASILILEYVQIPPHPRAPAWNALPLLSCGSLPSCFGLCFKAAFQGQDSADHACLPSCHCLSFLAFSPAIAALTIWHAELFLVVSFLQKE